jgi:hypothetical protein
VAASSSFARLARACALLACASVAVACSSAATSSGAGGAGTTDSGSGGGVATGGAGGATTTSTTTSSTTTSSGTGGSGGSAPLVCKQKYTSVKGGACDMLNQTCPAGQTCRPFSLGGGGVTTKCLSNSGLKSRGAPCTGDAECEAHLFCTGSPSAPGQCAPVCCPDTDDPCAGGKCNLSVSLGGNDFVYLCTYLAQCTLFTKDACAKGTACHLQDTTDGYAACVAPSGTNAPEGGACQYINDCGDMQLCAGGTCRYNCLLGKAGEGVAPGLGGCPAGETCQAQKTGIDGVGVCQP